MSFKRRLLECVMLSALALAGCSHETESPAVVDDKPLPDAVAPDLVCVEQLTTNVVVQGSGFTPMPTKTLKGGPKLVLPKVTLLQTEALDGSDKTASIDVPDSPDDTKNSHVQWQTGTQMSFDVFPDLSLAPGLYDIQITNPDGKHQAKLAGSMAGVPRPTATTITPDILCDAEDDQVVTIAGSGFLSVGDKLPTVHIDKKDFPASAVSDCADVPGKHAAGKVQTCSTLTFTLPMGSFDPGKFSVTVTNPETAACTSTDPLDVTVVPPPTLATIAPDLTCDAQGDQGLVVTGKDFLQIGMTLPTVQLGDMDFPVTSLDGCTAIDGPFAEGDVQKCTSGKLTLPKGALPAGDYAVAITNPKPANCQSLETGINLHVAPPPSVASVEADLVCDAQGDQDLTVKGSGFLNVGGMLPTLKVGDKMLTATDLADCMDVAGSFAEGKTETCSTLHFTLDKGTLDAGDYDIVVTNPDPAGCFSEESLSLHIAAPPSITKLAAVGLCDAEADQMLTINGTGFLQVGKTLPSVDVGGTMLVASAVGGCSAVKGTFTEGDVQICTSVTVTVAKNTFTPGDYPVVVTNPVPADCNTSEPTVLHVEPPPTVSSVAPPTVCTGGRQITITGTDFIATPSVELRAAGKATVASTAGMLAGSTQLTAQIGPGAEVGTKYDVVVINPDSCEDTAPHKTVTVVAGPLVYFADPEVVYNGINTRVTVYATGINGAVSDIQITPAGQLSPVTKLTWVDVPGHPNRGQVIIPKDTPIGKYDLSLTDATTCSTVLPNALTITKDLSVSIKTIDPPFGWTKSETAVTIKRDTANAAANKPFVATPRAFLNPTNPTANDVAIPLESVAFGDDATLTAVVPKDEPVHGYDLIVVNPDGTVGFLANAFTVQQLAPPTISTVTPSSIVAAAGQVVKVSGRNFRNSTITLSCVNAAGAAEAAPMVVSGAVTCDAQQNCTQDATIAAGALTDGSSCVLRLTDDDKSYFDFSAIGVTNSSLNLSDPKPGTNMTLGRRALAAASADATAAARFVYAIGGDGGKATENAPFKSVEYAPVDAFGNMGKWVVAANDLGTGRSFAGSTKLGRYIYLMGGSDGTTALDSAIRAMVLSPREVPALDVDDIVPADTGLDPGYYFYKVAATFAGQDTDNPNGESLPSDEFIVKVPSYPGKKIQVVLKWQPPVDSLGVALPNISGYRVYRTAAVNGQSGKEVLVASPPQNVTTLTDDGSLTIGSATPLPLGSTGTWATLPTLKAHRKGGAGAAAFDPGSTTKFYVYVGGGLDAASAEVASYEYLPVTIETNGHQTFGNAWTLGSKALSKGRWQLGAWVADNTTTTLITAPDTYVYFGGGVDAALGNVSDVDAGLVAAGGDLGTFTAVSSFNGTQAGYGVCAANDQLFTFGGGNAAPSTGATSATIGRKTPAVAPPNFAPGAWNAEGLNMAHPRYLLGSSVQSAFIFLIGGQTNTEAASATTELVIW